MRIRQPLSWYGGKYYLADRIVAIMPEHTHYVELFAGGLAVLWAKPCSGYSEVVNDIYGRLINFYRVLADEQLFARFIRRVEATPVSQELWKESRVASDDPLEDAVRFFVFNRQSRGAKMGEFVTTNRAPIRRLMNKRAADWLQAVDGLAEVHDRLRRVIFLNDDAVDVVRREGGSGTLFYADPPYLTETRISKNVYAHEMSEEDHRRLLDALKRTEGKVILSGYSNELYDRELKDWNRREFRVAKFSSTSGRKPIATEVIWMNYEPRGSLFRGGLTRRRPSGPRGAAAGFQSGVGGFDSRGGR